MKKVVLFTSSISLESGGTGFEVANLASALSQNKGIDVCILTYEGGHPYYTFDPSVKVNLLRFRSRPWRLVEDVLLIRRSFLAADVIFVTGIWGILDGLVLRVLRPLSVRCYIRVCGMLESYILNRNPWKKAIGRILYVNHNLSQSDGLIVNSEPEALQVASLGFKTPIHTLINGFQKPVSVPSRAQARAAMNIPTYSRVLLYIGRIHPKKGLHKLLPSLIDCMSLNPVYEDTTVLIAGKFSDDGYRRKICGALSRLPPKLEIKCLGDVRGKSKEIAFAASDVFVLPSESEGLPNAALESMSRGKPVALTPACNLPEVAAYGAGIVFSLDNHGIQEAVKWMLGPSDVLLQAGLRASNLFDDQFSSDTMLRQYLQLIDHNN
jgi:poly(glycerol-phosphate) alpha-glucosyltransferase